MDPSHTDKRENSEQEPWRAIRTWKTSSNKTPIRRRAREKAKKLSQRPLSKLSQKRSPSQRRSLPPKSKHPSRSSMRTMPPLTKTRSSSTKASRKSRTRRRSSKRLKTSPSRTRDGAQVATSARAISRQLLTELQRTVLRPLPRDPDQSAETRVALVESTSVVANSLSPSSRRVERRSATR